jgi:ribosomal protein S18 acetylase RimI-like enzyme
MIMNHLTFAPYDSQRDSDVGQLFHDYKHKDHQLKVMGVSKERMVKYLGKSISKHNMQTICLREKGRLVGLIALQSLPWMSKHFGLRMFAVSHLLARSTGPLVHVRLLRYVIEELQDVDFLDCRVAIDDIYSAHALEICDFRYVGTEIYMGQVLKSTSPPKPHRDYEIRPCAAQEREQVVQIAGETHVHNRFVQDPIIHENTTKSLYERLVTNCFKDSQFNVLVAHSHGEVHGFIITKMNLPFSQEVGQLCGSLDFIGVRPEARNRGLGVTLNQWALYHLAEKNAVFAAVRTLASNYAALATCFRTGFSITSTSLHFHKWIRRPALYHKESQSYPNDRVLNIQ